MATVTIGCYDGSLDGHDRVVVAVDVLRSVTTAVTAIVAGGRCIVASSLDDAVARAAATDGLLVGELGGHMPYGFDLTNSPVAVAARADVSRPIVLVSSSGTALLGHAAAAAETAFAGCLRNVSATAAAVAATGASAAVLGAPTRGEFRAEDQLCCAWIARRLLAAGYDAGDEATDELVSRWGDRDAGAIVESPSAAYLRDTGQAHDLDFVLTHVDDVPSAFRVVGNEVVVAA